MREKPYIAFLIDTLQTGGAEKSILAIASKLKLVQPVVCHIYQNDELKHHFNKSGIRVISLDVKGPYSFKEASNKLHSVLKQEKPDLVVATLLRSELISRWVCKRMNIPNVGTFVSDTYAPNALQTMSWLMCIKVRFFWLLNVLTARWCVAFLANSESIKQSNCNALYVSPHKVKVIYRGRTTDNFQFAKHNIQKEAPRLLSVGRLLYLKGFIELLLAFKQYKNYFQGAVLNIAGEGAYRSTLERRINELNLSSSVTLLGNRSDIPSLMQEHDIFVFPSHYEGFSGTLVEAMLSGIPIVASDIAMNKEAVAHGETARLFKVKDATALYTALIEATENYDESVAMAATARRVAEERFSIEVIAQQHEDFYLSLLR